MPGCGGPSQSLHGVLIVLPSLPQDCHSPGFRAVAVQALFLTVDSFILFPGPPPAVSEFFVHFQRPFLQAYPVSSRLLSGSHSLSFACLFMALLGSGEDFTGTYVSDLTILFILEA